MNVLLIYPSFPDTFWSLKHALKFVGKRSVMPPLGLLTVAAMLPEAWSIRLVDTNVRCLTDDDLEWADLGMISAMAVQRRSAEQLIDRCIDAGVRIVAGGPLFTAEPHLFDRVDHLVLNEAELTLPEFLTDLRAGIARHCYTSDRFADVTQSPVPRWDLLDMQRYFTMGLQYSRGCPFDCEFCDVTNLFGRKPRFKSPAQVVHELDSLRAIGWRGSVFFVDDNLIGNRRAASQELLPALIEWQQRQHGPRTAFNTQASINLADDADLLRMMPQAGFDTVFVGIETPDADALQECGKRQNCKRDLINSIKTIQRSGIQVQGGFIVGFDSDQQSIFQRQIDLIQKSGVVTAMVGLLNALPGTRLYQRLEIKGRLQGSGTGDNVDGTTNIVPIMDPTELSEGYQRILQTIYQPANYYRRIRTFLREYRPIRSHAGNSLRFGRLLAFFRSVVWLGIVGKERWHHWYTLAWTLVRRPNAIQLAVTLAIMGHHFRKVCLPQNA